MTMDCVPIGAVLNRLLGVLSLPTLTVLVERGAHGVS